MWDTGDKSVCFAWHEVLGGAASAVQSTVLEEKHGQIKETLAESNRQF